LEYGRTLVAGARRGNVFPVVGSSGIVGHNSTALVEGPGIVVGRKGTVGSIIWSSSDFWPIDTTYFVRWLDGQATDRRWTYWVLSTLNLNRLDSSTGVPGLNRNDVYSIELKCPLLPEQRRIAEILDSVDESIRSTEGLIAKLEAAKKGLVADLVGDAPVGQRDSLNDHAKLLSGQHISAALVNDQGFGVPYLTGPADFVGDRAIATRFTEYPKVVCDRGDVLLTVKGSGCGKIAIAAQRSCISRQLMALKFDCSSEELVYWCEWLKSKSNELGSLAASGLIPGLSRDQILTLPVRRASSGERAGMGAFLHGYGNRIRNERETAHALGAVRQGLMEDLLTGRVRVKIEEGVVA